MENWLVKRLTPAKQGQPRWVDFAEMAEKIWEEFFDPEISRLENLRSSYTADDRDLARMIRLMGDYFSYELPKEEDKPIALAWRRLEIDYKDMELILRSAFRRHFGDFRAEWFPLFAPKDKPYGSEFLVSNYLLHPRDKNIAPEGYFLTSRGVVGVDKFDLYRDGMDTGLFEREALPLVTRIKPLHIVFDGFFWILRFNLGTFRLSFSAAWDSLQDFTLQFGPIGTRFDYTPADVRRLDVDVFEIWREGEWNIELPFWGADCRIWPLDMFLPDGFGDRLPLDLLYPLACERFTREPFNLLYREISRSFSVAVREMEVRRQGRTEWTAEKSHVLPSSIVVPRRETDVLIFLPFITSHVLLDAFLPDGFADIVPVDVLRHMVQGEQYNASPIDVVFREGAVRWTIDFLAPFAGRDHLARRLDLFLPDGFGDRLPLDTLLSTAFSGSMRDQLAILFMNGEQQVPVVLSPGSIASTGVMEEAFELSFLDSSAYGLDRFLPDGFADMVPVDALRHGLRRKKQDPVSIVFHDTGSQYRFSALAPHITTPSWENKHLAAIGVSEGSLAVRETADTPQAIAAFRGGEPCFDQIPRFDEIPGDFMPCDYPYGGFV